MGRIDTSNGFAMGMLFVAITIMALEPLGIKALSNSLIPNGYLFLRDTFLTGLVIISIVLLFVGGED